MFESHKFIVLTDVPFTADQAMYNYFSRLKQTFDRLAGLHSEDDRVVTIGDLKKLGLI